MKKPKTTLIITNIDANNFLKQIEGILDKKLAEFSKTPSNEDERKFLTSKELNAVFKINRTTLWKYEKKGLLKPVKFGRFKYYNFADIEKLFDKREDGNK